MKHRRAHAHTHQHDHQTYINSANIKFFIFCESKTQVINIMPFGCLMSYSDLCQRITL